MIPTTYEEWKTCIIEHCRIPLTEAFVLRRLAVYEDRQHPETKSFVKLYGEQHFDNVIYWLKKRLNETK